jgi:hypothetical protein
MADNTIIQQGRFTSNGLRKTLAIRSDVDWMKVYNESQYLNLTLDRPTDFYWQRGMAAGLGLKTVKLGASAGDPLTNGQVGAGLGFTLVNQGSDAVVSSAVAFTAVSNVVQPIVSTANTALLQAGDVVRFSQIAAGLDAKSLLGIDFQIDTIVANTSFRIANALQQAVGAGTNGFWRKVNISSIFYPETRYIVNITTANPLFPIVTTSVDHGYVVGQEVRFHVSSSVNGMVEINEVTAPITAVTAATFTVDLDTTGFTAFVFPTTANYPGAGYTPAFVGPVGEDTAAALNAVPQADILSDATVNTAIIGMQLSAGTAAGVNVGPAGENGNVMYWVAGKSFSVTNE